MKDISDNIKQKIEEIKLARMGKEYRFVSEFFSDLEVKYVPNMKNVTFFFKDGKPVMKFIETGGYLWCHNELCWQPLERILTLKLREDFKYVGALSFSVKKEMRKILEHFALAYFDISDVTVSTAVSNIVNKWETYKFTNKKSW